MAQVCLSVRAEPLVVVAQRHILARQHLVVKIVADLEEVLVQNSKPGHVIYLMTSL